MLARIFNQVFYSYEKVEYPVKAAVPTFVCALLMVIGNVSIKVVDTFFPRLVLLKKWIGCMLCYCSQGEASIFLVSDIPFIQHQETTMPSCFFMFHLYYLGSLGPIAFLQKC